MRITDIVIDRVSFEYLRCIVTWEDLSQTEAVIEWMNEKGLWASNDPRRDPAEIAAHLRNFARVIEESAQQHEAA